MATPSVQVGATPAFDIRPLNSVGRTDSEVFGSWLGAAHYASQYAATSSVMGWRVKCTTTLPSNVGMGTANVGNAIVTYTGELLIVESYDLADLRPALTEALKGNVDFTQ